MLCPMVPVVWVNEEVQLSLECEDLGWGWREVRFGNKWDTLLNSHYVSGTVQNFLYMLFPLTLRTPS